MSRQALAQVIQRSISDPAFRSQLTSDVGGALRGYDLSDDEATAIRTRDAARLTGYGIDRRMSKAFSNIDPGSPGFSAVTGGEPRDAGGPVWIGDSSELPAGSVQSPDAIDRNFSLAIDDNAHQSPDAIDRNLDASLDNSHGDGNLQQ